MLYKGVKVFCGVLIFFGGIIYIFDYLDRDVKSYGLKLLCMEDFKRVFLGVVWEIVIREVILGGLLGIIVLVLDIDFL